MNTPVHSLIIAVSRASGGAGGRGAFGGRSRGQADSPAGPFRSLVRAVALALALAPGALWAQSNIVANGGFELGATGWEFAGASSVAVGHGGGPNLAGEGTNYALVREPVFQDLSTLPGRDYLLQFDTGTSLPRVSWGGAVAGPFTNGATLAPNWRVVYCHVRATGEVTRLTFETSSPGPNGQPAPWMAVDDVRVGHLQEPAGIQVQPRSRTVYEGSGVSFAVGASGGPPLRYQWLFDGTPIPDATNSSFTLSMARTNQAGAYSVVVSNDFGSQPSESALLNVEPSATSPVIVGQPASQTVPAGYGCNLRVVALGAPVLSYQWLLDGTSLPGATNANLGFDAVQAAQAGAYSVLVSNDQGATLSLTATLVVTNAAGGARFMCTNSSAICDVDGSTRLSGTSFSAQTYAGSAPESLRPLGSRKFFNTGTRVGFITTAWVTSPNVPVGSKVYAQMRVWESAWGESYEAARAQGGKFGFSEIQSATGGASTLIRVAGFRLQAGLPFFYAGRLAVGERRPDGTQEFLLQGQPGFRYLIEKQSPPNLWSPLVVVTNLTGTVSFTDAQQNQGTVSLYRSRLLD